jgi:hypothetical protein
MQRIQECVPKQRLGTSKNAVCIIVSPVEDVSDFPNRQAELDM